MTRVTRTSILSGVTSSRQIDVDAGLLKRWEEGIDRRLIQDAFPHLNADDREFIMTGITPEEWEKTFGVDDLPDEDEFWRDLKGEEDELDLVDPREEEVDLDDQEFEEEMMTREQEEDLDNQAFASIEDALNSMFKRR